MSDKYSVYGFQGDVHTNRLKFVPVEAALKEAHVYFKSGQFTRIIITDSGDCINFEWTAKDGVIYPIGKDKGNLDVMFPKRVEHD